MSYDTANDKVVVFVKNTSGDLLGFVGTVSGTDISFGSASANLDGGGSNAQPSPKGQQYLPNKVFIYVVIIKLVILQVQQ